MNIRCLKLKINSIVTSVALVTFTLLLAISGLGQTRAPSGSTSTTGGRPPGGKDLETLRREENATEREERRSRIAEDFQHLQGLYGELKQVASAEVLDYARVAKTTEEIKTHAARLNTDLSLPKIGKDKRPKDQFDPDKGQMKESLFALNEMIAGFITNPTFQRDKAYDPQMAGKARSDLEGIIELSGKIKKSADKLKKATGKSKIMPGAP